MSNSLANWATQTLKVVDEDGEGVKRVRLLSTDGTVWQTWDAPFGDVDEWLQQSESLLSDLGDEFSGEVQLVFVAEGAAGTQRSQFPKRINGRKRPAQGGAMFGGGTASAPLQAMYEAQAKTTEKVLQTANVQLEVLTRTVETQARANGELLEYIRASNEHQALNSQVSNKVSEAVGELLQSAPMLLELILSAKTKKPSTAAAAVATKAAGAVKDQLVEAATEVAANGARALTQTVLKGDPS